jgi:hypothetical protein
MDMDGNYMVIAMTGKYRGGKVYFYERIGDAWSEVYSEISDISSVAINGDQIVIGNSWANKLRIFKRKNGQWTFLQEIAGPSDHTGLGRIVDMKGGRLVAPSIRWYEDPWWKPFGGTHNANNINLYKYSPSDEKWNLEQRFEENDYWACTPHLTADGNTIMIGQGLPSNSLKFHNGKWEKSLLYPMGGFATQGDYFVISGEYKNQLFRKDPEDGNYNMVGSFDKEFDQWGGEQYGSDVALTDHYLVVGAPENHFKYEPCKTSGAAFVYDRKEQFTVPKLLCYHPFGIPTNVEGRSIYVAGRLCSDYHLTSGSFDYRAVEKIVLQPGFQVTAGATFRAHIVGCSNFNNGFLNDNAGGRLAANDLYDESTEEEQLNVDKNLEAAEAIEEGVQVFPNPVTGNNFKVISSEPITEIYLFSLQGQVMTIRKENISEGIVNVQIDSNPDGIFVLQVKTGKKTVFRKLRLNGN